MSLRKMFGKTMLCAMLGASLLAGVATPANADRDEKCRRDIRKAVEKLEKAVRKHGEGSRQAEQRSRRQQFVVPAITYQRRIVQSRRGGNTVAVSRLHDCVVGVAGVPVGSRSRHLSKKVAPRVCPQQ
jgi:hypothetical protein